MRAAIVALALSAAAAASVAAAPAPGAIRVVSAGHEVVFPHRIELTLTAESDSPITEVSVHYRLGDGPAFVYGYPDFEPGRSVDATFAIETGGAAFLPSGVDVEYHYLLRDESGATLRTASYGLTYLDPRYEWRSLAVGAIDVLWHDRPRAEVEAAAWDADARAAAVARALGLPEVPRMRAVILNDRAEAARSFAPISRAATDGHLYAGFAYAEFDLFLLLGLGADGMAHEAAHLLVDEAVPSPLARVPAWYEEGLAMHFEPGASRTDLFVASAARSGDLLAITRMDGRPGRPLDVRLFYAQARSLFGFMVDAHGEAAVTGLFAALGRGERFDDAFASAYGIGPAAMEDRWREHLGAPPRVTERPAERGAAGGEGPAQDPAPAGPEPGADGYEPYMRADPGTFGTSLLLALSTAFAAAVAGGGWLLRRRRAARRGDDEPEGFDPRYDTPP